VASGYTDSQGKFSLAVNGKDNAATEFWLEANNSVVRVWADLDCVKEPVNIGFPSFNSQSAATLTWASSSFLLVITRFQSGSAGARSVSMSPGRFPEH